MTINERLFDLLADHHLTQKALADFIGVNERNIGTWKMRGSDPPAKLVYKIAEFFGVSVEWFLTGEEHPRTSFVNNGSLSGNLGPHTGTLVVRNGGERVLSAECSELLRIYESLGVRDRMALLSAAFEIADKSAPAPDPESGGDG